MLKSITRIFLIKNPSFQYTFYLLNGIAKQLINLFVKRKIKNIGSQKFLLIVGAGRSGNTLLRRLLIENGEIYIPPESYVFASIVTTHLKATALNWNDTVDLTLSKFEYHPEFETFEIDSLRDFSILAKKFVKEKQQIGTLIIELYKWIASKKGHSQVWLGDKTPVNTLDLGLIKKLFPEAVYIYLERDGVDVSHSYIKTKTYDKIEDAALRWKDSRIAWNKFKHMIPEKHYIEIKYENLVKNHEDVIEMIFKKFDIPTKKHISDMTSSLGDVSMRAHHKNVNNAPNVSSIGKGRRFINNTERQALKDIIGKELADAGYTKL
jgi:protein-tyrosine sulfotransferase